MRSLVGSGRMDSSWESDMNDIYSLEIKLYSRVVDISYI